MSEEDFEIAAAHLKITAIEIMIYTADQEFLLVMPNTGAAVGKWCFPGCVALRGSKLREIARRHLHTALDVRIPEDDAFRVKMYTNDERNWQEESGVSREYIVFTFLVGIEREEIANLHKDLAQKYNEARFFSTAAIKGGDFHPYVSRYVSQLTSEWPVRPLFV